jgi:uncharacterized membrane protein YhaH (DUF805 family)
MSTDYLYYIAPVVITFLLILFGSNFENEDKPILSDNMHILFHIIFGVFIVIWILSLLGALANYFHDAQIANSIYLLCAFLLFHYQKNVKDKSIINECRTK